MQKIKRDLGEIRTLFTTTLCISCSVVREVGELPQDVNPCFYDIKSCDSKKRELESKVVNEEMVCLLKESYT
jgi:hypothetical protein